jgi:2,4-dienoyl-CoA reductase-like NADH-dependent reductase (Old Yellow Enzyme family)
MRFLLRVVKEVRAAWPEEKPLLVRISATDWVEGGLTVDDQVVVARELLPRGVDLVDCSSGGAVPVGPPDPGAVHRYRGTEIRGFSVFWDALVPFASTPEDETRGLVEMPVDPNALLAGAQGFFDRYTGEK